jgi:hypothetical protein
MCYPAPYHQDRHLSRKAVAEATHRDVAALRLKWLGAENDLEERAWNGSLIAGSSVSATSLFGGITGLSTTF